MATIDSFNFDGPASIVEDKYERSIELAEEALGRVDDRVLEDYTGCTAELQIRHPETNALIKTLNTTNSGIVLDANTLRLFISHADTAALVYGETAPAWTYAVGHVEVTRADGTRERQYSITFPLNPELTV